MLTLNEIYHIVLAEKHGLDWDCQDNLQDAYETYTNLSEKKQAEFNGLVNQAVAECKDDFNEFPGSYQDQIDLERRQETIDTIMEKLEPIFQEYLQ